MVEEQDKITHQVQLDDELNCMEEMNFFKFDPAFSEKEKHWDAIKKEIVGDYFD